MRKLVLILALVSVSLLTSAAAAAAADPVYSNWRGLAIRGADPVAYFTDGAYRPGKSEHSIEWKGATWRFSTAANRDLFAANPEQYEPEFGGYCAYAISQGSLVSSDPESFSLVNGKLYLNYSASVHKKWLKDQQNYIDQANAQWPGLLGDR